MFSSKGRFNSYYCFFQFIVWMLVMLLLDIIQFVIEYYSSSMLDVFMSSISELECYFISLAITFLTILLLYIFFLVSTKKSFYIASSLPIQPRYTTFQSQSVTQIVNSLYIQGHVRSHLMWKQATLSAILYHYTLVHAQVVLRFVHFICQLISYFQLYMLPTNL